MRTVRAMVWVAGMTLVLAGSATSQELDLANYDYENLSFRGVVLDAGYMWADNVENTWNYSMRFDLGFLGPGFRLMPGLTYWDSEVSESEVARFEAQVTSLIVEQGGTPPVGGIDLRQVDREDLALTLDGHYVWSMPADLFFYAGLGFSAHFLNGSGAAIDDTFVEDLLDSVSAGANLHAGLSLAVADRFRVFAGSKAELLGDLKYIDVRFGMSYIFGGLVSGEIR